MSRRAKTSHRGRPSCCDGRALAAGDERNDPGFLCPVCGTDIDADDDKPIIGDDGKARCRNCHDYREEFGIDYGACS